VITTDEYIHPGELVGLIAFLFAPALLLALVGQALFFAARGMFRHRQTRALLALLGTALLSVGVGTAVLLLSPPVLPHLLAVRDVTVRGQLYPVLPLAFVVVAIVAPLAAWWAVRGARADYGS